MQEPFPGELKGLARLLENHSPTQRARPTAGRPKLQGLAWVLEPKIDGLAVSATYKDGRLVQVGGPYKRGSHTTGVTHPDINKFL